MRGDEANTQPKLPAYSVIDGSVTGRWRGFEGFVRINDLLDNRCETFGTFAPNARMPGTPVERFLSPAPPINVVAGPNTGISRYPEVQLRCALTKRMRTAIRSAKRSVFRRD